MNCNSSSTRRASAAALCLACGLPCAALGIDKSWNSGSGLWNDAARWFPMGVPAATDGVRLGNVEGVQNSTVTLNGSPDIASLEITDGMTLRTNLRVLSVSGDVLVSGSNSVMGPGGQFIEMPSRLHLDIVDGLTMSVDDMSITAGGLLELDGAYVHIAGTLSTGDTGVIRGLGTLDFYAGGVTFTNRGVVRPQADHWGIIMRQFGTGVYDLDGSTGNGRIDLAPEGTSGPGSRLEVDGAPLSDSFDGVVSFTGGSELDMQLPEPWRATAASRFEMAGHGGAVAHAVVRGAPLNFAGELVVQGADASLTLESSTLVLEPEARVVAGPGAMAGFGTPGAGSVIVEGGQFVAEPGANIRFHGPTQIAGGSFSTPSPNWVNGYVIFEGPVAFAGNVSFAGAVMIQGAAVVAAPTVIDADTFDMDGPQLINEDGPIPAAPWTINSTLVIEAGALSTSSNQVRTPITIGGGAAARLTVTLDEPGEEWRSTGSISLAGLAGGPHLLVNRVAGSPVAIAGSLSLPSGRVSISAPVRFEDGSSLVISGATAEIRFTGDCRVGGGTSIAGAGTLVAGPSATMTLDHGVTAGEVGVTNLGRLRLADGPGFISVDRLQTSGVVEVEIGGRTTGSEHDQLVVTGGPAALAGQLDVRVINGFRPAVGESFTVLTTIEGTSGAFAPTAVSNADGWTYHWNVSNLAGDVVVTLASAEPPPCAADFDGNGIINSQDFFAFIARFLAEDELADFNGDGQISSQDLFDFLAVFFGECG